MMPTYSQTYDGARVLITGGLGFIGSNLARVLCAQGAHVVLVDSLIPTYGGNMFNVRDLRDKVVVNISDVRDPYAMAELVKGQDFLFNLAGQTSHLDSMLQPELDLEINVQAQLSILEACRRHNSKARLVFASTRQLYGRPQYLPVDEKHPIKPVDVNGINKLAGESYHVLYSEIYGIRSTVLRLTNTYGPGMRVRDAKQTFLGIWVRQLLQGQPISVFGTGDQLRDFNYVDDCVNALLLAGASDQGVGRVFNLGSKEVVSLKAVAQMLVNLEPGAKYATIPFPPERKAIDIGDYYGDHTLFSQVYGWTPVVDLADGLRKTVDYYREHGERYWENDQ